VLDQKKVPYLLSPHIPSSIVGARRPRQGPGSARLAFSRCVVVASVEPEHGFQSILTPHSLPHCLLNTAIFATRRVRCWDRSTVSTPPPPPLRLNISHRAQFYTTSQQRLDSRSSEAVITRSTCVGGGRGRSVGRTLEKCIAVTRHRGRAMVDQHFPSHAFRTLPLSAGISQLTMLLKATRVTRVTQSILRCAWPCVHSLRLL
jgi:hypothetical protein